MNYVATVQYGGEFQPTLEDLAEPLRKIKDKCVYWVMGKEIAPTTGQKHLQCYFQFKDQIRRSTLARILQCWWQGQAEHATAEQARDYCTKEGDFLSGGEIRGTQSKLEKGRKRGGQATADKWTEARTIALDPFKNLDEVDPQIFICHYGALQSIRKTALIVPKTLDWHDGDPPNLWLYGSAGCGKSRRAREILPDAYLKMCNKWWDGYRQQEGVIIDDFDEEHKCLGHHIKIWCDRYGFIGESKFGALSLRPKVIIITSNWAPKDIWTDEKTLKPILRRFKVMNMSPLTEQTTKTSGTSMTWNGNAQSDGVEATTGCTEPLQEWNRNTMGPESFVMNKKKLQKAIHCIELLESDSDEETENTAPMM